MATLTHSPDPLIPVDEVAESAPGMDYEAHVKTFNAVLGAAKWFVIHVAVLLASVYFLAIAGQPVVGAFGIACSAALLAFGMLRRPSVRNDVVKGLAAGPTAPEPRHIDPTPGLGDETA